MSHERFLDEGSYNRALPHTLYGFQINAATETQANGSDSPSPTRRIRTSLRISLTNTM